MSEYYSRFDAVTKGEKSLELRATDVGGHVYKSNRGKNGIFAVDDSMHSLIGGCCYISS